MKLKRQNTFKQTLTAVSGIGEVLRRNKTDLEKLYFKRPEKKSVDGTFMFVPHGKGGYLQHLYHYYYDKVSGCFLEGNRVIKFVTPVKTMKSILAISDIVVFNMGAHYLRCTLFQFAESFQSMSKLLKTELQKNPGKRIIVRNTLPSHFKSRSQLGLFMESALRENTTCMPHRPLVGDPTTSYQRVAADRLGFLFLDGYNIYKTRYDLHSLTDYRDCTHWCYTPELIIPEMALLNQLL